MVHELPPLPYAEDALEPHYSARTISFHYGKHHKTYVDNLNKLIVDTPEAKLSLEELIRQDAENPARTACYNNAAQVWNHTFFWNCMKPNGGGKLPLEASRRICGHFGSCQAFADQFAAAAVGRFGSGWAWLVLDEGVLKITSTPNADTPLAHGQVPLLTVDVWEHAYYLDYQNRRADYVKIFLEHLVNWEFVEHNLATAR